MPLHPHPYLRLLVLLLVIQVPNAIAQAQPCPDLSAYYQMENPNWTEIEAQLSPLMSRCLHSSDYYALLGASQIHTGRLAQALESLERSLLLSPDNGAAQIDYAQALYLQGQLFPALEMNQRLMRRQDLPAHLSPMLRERQQEWQSMTRQLAVQGDILAGYDNNLNGAPAPDQITLTLSGESVILPLNPEYRPEAGPYLNLRLGARYRQLAPRHQHNVLVELRGRVSEHDESDMLQLDTRYAVIEPGSQRSRQFTVGMSHLQFGGKALYTATEAGGRMQFDVLAAQCRPFVTAAAQHQYFHSQTRLNALESKLGSGLNCPFNSGAGRQMLTPELNVLYNNPVRDGRPGGARVGWQFNLDWQLELSRGVVSAQLNHTRTLDAEGYSPLLGDDARRQVQRSYLLVQYRQPLSPNTNFMVNLYTQEQRSNLELFRSNDSTAEIGINYRF